MWSYVMDYFLAGTSNLLKAMLVPSRPISSLYAKLTVFRLYLKIYRTDTGAVSVLSFVRKKNKRIYPKTLNYSFKRNSLDDSLFKRHFGSVVGRFITL